MTTKVGAGLAGLLLAGMAGAGASQPTLGGMGRMAPPPAEGAAERQPTEHGTRQVDGLEVTLLSAPPLSAAEMERLMPGMGGKMPGMPGVRGTMPGMGGMGVGEGQPTHWIGVIVRDRKTDRIVPDLAVTVTARWDGVSRTVTLMPMPGSYGAHLSLPGPGRYAVTVSIARPGQAVTAAFEFEYQ